MSIREIHENVKLKYNKIDSNHNRDFPPALLDMIINNVINDYIDIFYEGKNNKGYVLGIEGTQKTTDMLSTLVTSKVISSVPDSLEYELDPINYRNFIRASVTDSCGVVNVKVYPHGELNTVLNNPLKRSSKKWRRIVSAIRSSTSNDYYSSLFLYSSPDYDIPTNLKLDLEFIRKPRAVFFGGYNSLDGQYFVNDNPVTSDLPESYHNLLCDMVVQELSNILLDANKYQLMMNKLNNA